MRAGGVGLALVLVLFAAPSWSRSLVVFGGSAVIPFGDTDDFSDPGAGFEVRYRHQNAGHSAYELCFGYIAAPLSGAIPDSIASFEALLREKNLRAQQASQPGQGTILAEYGKLEVYNVTANFSYRFNQRARFSPVFSVGGGVYVWRIPFKVQFFNVPSFGEQRAYHPIGDSGYQFTFDERYPDQVIDFTKHETTGGLNAAFGLDMRASRHWGVGLEGRAHLIFSSGTGDQELPEDDQLYLDNMTLLYLQGSVYYRF